MELARRAGFRAIVLSSVWTPPLDGARPTRSSPGCAARSTPPTARRHPADRRRLLVQRRHAADAGGARPSSPRTRPRSSQSIPELRDVSVGNEPNLNLFWHAAVRRRTAPTRPQPPTSSCSRETYDAIKAVDPHVNVIGGSLAARGERQPGGRRGRRTRRRGSSRISAPPTARAGARAPVLDMFSLHPYPENSSDPADVRAPALDARSGSPTTTSSCGCSTSAFGQAAADRLRRVRDRDAHPGRRARARTRASEPPTTQAGRRRRRRPPDYVAGDPAGGLPAAGPDAALLPRHRRVRSSQRLQTRPLLPDDTAEARASPRVADAAARGRGAGR